MLKKINSKKAFIERATVNMILMITVVLMITLIIYNVRLRTTGQSSEAACALSIDAHISFVESKLMVKQEAQDIVGPMSLFLVSEADPPAIECNTKFIESKSKNRRDAEKELLESADDTWKMFKNGKAIIYPGLNKESFCFVESVHEFKKNYDLNFSEAVIMYPVKEYLDNYMTESTQMRVEKMQALHPEYELTFFDYMQFYDTDSHVIAKAAPNLNAKKMYFAGHLYYPGDIAESNNDFDYSPLGASVNLGIEIAAKGILGNIFFPDFLENPDLAGNNMKSFMLQYIQDFRNFDLTTIENTYVGFSDNTKPLYAVIYHQYHYNAPEDWFDTLAQTIRSLTISEEAPRYFLFSSIMIVPYTEEVMSTLNCEYMPVEFEN